MSSVTFTPSVSAATVTYKTLAVDSLNIAYREAGEPSSPKLVLLHGWPSSSHQFRNLIPALANRFHVICPDYPGFGNSDTPDPAKFSYTFDNIADIVDRFLELNGFKKYGLFVHDYGGPVGFRILTKKPDVLEWLVIQNANTYEVGFSAVWGGFRNQLWKKRTPENEAGVEGLLARDTIKTIYLAGATNPELISPDNWNADYYVTMQRPHSRQIQMDLFYDYRTNVDLYPKWQKFLKEHQPKTIIFWGQGDFFLSPKGGDAYLEALPSAEIHKLAAGHFAVEDCLDYIAEHIHRFYDKMS